MNENQIETIKNIATQLEITADILLDTLKEAVETNLDKYSEDNALENIGNARYLLILSANSLNRIASRNDQSN